MQDTELTLGYLQDALENGGIKLFLLALKDIVEANKGINNTGNEANLEKEKLFTEFLANKEPQLVTIEKVLKSLGFQMSVTKILPLSTVQ